LIGLTLGIGFGAINSGNNLLFLILGMLLSLIVVSGVLSELSLRGVTIARVFNAGFHAGQETLLALEITNTKRFFSSYSLEVEELLGGAPGARQLSAYALVVRPGESVRVAIRMSFQRRGVVQSAGLRVATRYPFSFFRKWLEISDPVELTIYPEVRSVAAPVLSGWAMGALESHGKIGRGGEYHGLREYRSDDDPRDIHWKSSARTGRLVLREYEQPADRRIIVVIPNMAFGGTEQATEAAEEGITEAASLAAHYAHVGWAVGLRSLDGTVNPDTGPVHLRGIFEHLARIPVHTSARGREILPVQGRADERIENVLVQHEALGPELSPAGFGAVHEVSRAV
jgi:uncharacterized protein (DUF58 family)